MVTFQKQSSYTLTVVAVAALKGLELRFQLQQFTTPGAEAAKVKKPRVSINGQLRNTSLYEIVRVSSFLLLLEKSLNHLFLASL